MNVVCCSRDWCFKGYFHEQSQSGNFADDAEKVKTMSCILLVAGETICSHKKNIYSFSKQLYKNEILAKNVLLVADMQIQSVAINISSQ